MSYVSTLDAAKLLALSQVPHAQHVVLGDAEYVLIGKKTDLCRVLNRLECSDNAVFVGYCNLFVEETCSDGLNKSTSVN